jgi:two-component system, LytTR family, response regulator
MKQIWKTLIVDDERLARMKLRKLLADFPNIKVVGEADGVQSALKILEETAPDVVFLDVQMPQMTGFELLERTEAEFKTIFVTAYDQYAIRAFEVNALDYLLKPVNVKRLEQAIERLSLQTSTKPTDKNLEYEDFLFLNFGRHSRFVRVSEIKCIAAADVYSEIILEDDNIALILKPLAEWEQRLPKQNFVRIHRSTIVNLAFVERVESLFNYSCEVYVKGFQKPLTMSRRYAAQVKNRLG